MFYIITQYRLLRKEYMKNLRNYFFTHKFDCLYLLIIIFLAFILRMKDIDKGMIFIGDQGWFYLSARDLLLTHTIPLVGITSSHTWLHQGPWWTYFLAAALYVGSFNPISGAYLSIIIDLITIGVMYVVGYKVFSKSSGIIASIMYTFSPLAVVYSRMPYHTNPIPLFVLLWFFSLYKLWKGEKSYFPLLILSLSFLYNFELASVLLLLLSIPVLFIAWITKRLSFETGQRNTFILSILALFPMIPILIFDTTHGWKQTIVFAGWTLFQLVHIFIPSTDTQTSLLQMVYLTGKFLQRMLFISSFLTTMGLLLCGFVGYIVDIKKRTKKAQTNLLFYITGGILIGFIGTRTPSEAYVPLFMPFIILFLSVIFAEFTTSFWKRIIIILLLFGFVVRNAHAIISSSFLVNTEGGYGPSLEKRMEAMEVIVASANGSPFALDAKGEGSQFESFTTNYQYLLWYKHANLDQNAALRFTIEDTYNAVRVTKE